MALEAPAININESRSFTTGRKRSAAGPPATACSSGLPAWPPLRCHGCHKAAPARFPFVVQCGSNMQSARTRPDYFSHEPSRYSAGMPQTKIVWHLRRKPQVPEVACPPGRCMVALAHRSGIQHAGEVAKARGEGITVEQKFIQQATLTVTRSDIVKWKV